MMDKRWWEGFHWPEYLAGYIVSQFLGAALGASLLVFVWRDHAASVHNGITAPGTGYSLWNVFLIETGLTRILVMAIFLFVGSRHLMQWTPLMTRILVAEAMAI